MWFPGFSYPFAGHGRLRSWAFSSFCGEISQPCAWTYGFYPDRMTYSLKGNRCTAAEVPRKTAYSMGWQGNSGLMGVTCQGMITFFTFRAVPDGNYKGFLEFSQPSQIHFALKPNS